MKPFCRQFHDLLDFSGNFLLGHGIDLADGHADQPLPGIAVKAGGGFSGID